MTREIKFRAWDGYEMRYRWNGFEDVDPLNLSDLMYPYCNGNLMQFTGLLDKKGKEIYEGDILQNDWNHNKFVVEWGEGEYPYQSDADSTANKWNVKYGGCEIIGNIYENPELIK